MNEVWKNIFRNWIKSYESIQHLEKEGIVEDYRAEQLRETLLEEILNTCISEVEEDCELRGQK